MHVITEYQQQLEKRLFIFAASRLYDYQARGSSEPSSHATSKIPPVYKSDVLPMHDAFDASALLTHADSVKAIAE